MTEESTAVTDMAPIYERRNGNLQRTIDVLAQYTRAELEEYGRQAEIAREHDLDTGRITYVLDEWSNLVRWRRNADTNPLDPAAVKQAYDDETMQAMVDEQTAVADGVGNVTVSVDLELDEAFRAVKLLPGDLAVSIFTQTIEDSQGLSHEVMDQVLNK